MYLAGRLACITDAGSGIGKVMATLLAEQGAKLAALSNTMEESHWFRSK